MRRTRRMRKTAALFAAGGMMLQFGGYDFFRVVARSIPVGVGQTLGAAIPLGGALVLGAPTLDALVRDFVSGINLGGITPP